MRILERHELGSIKKGVTFGRFSPFKTGHRRGIEEILEYCQQLTLGVIDSNTPKKTVAEHFRKFCEAADKKNTAEHTQFSLEERLNLTRLSLEDLIKDGNVLVQSIFRPEYDPEIFNRQFPKGIYDVLFSKVDDDPFDRERNCVMEQIIGREILFVKPIAPILHNSDILKKIGNGEIDWRDVIPKNAYEKFVRYAKNKPKYNLK